jgi:serine/threonine protein kinase
MEFCSGGNLKDLLRSSRVNEESCVQYNNIYSKLTERQLINFAAEVARGMKYLFEKKVMINLARKDFRIQIPKERTA